MGAWGPGLFSDDLACDVRDEYRELIEDGATDEEARRRVVESYSEALDDPGEAPVFWLALAVTESKLGRLDAVVRDRALGIIERGDDGPGVGVQEEGSRLPGCRFHGSRRHDRTSPGR
ncbi:hypothetical protein ACWCOT_20055 [Nonomuraea bangladeshensis]